MAAVRKEKDYLGERELPPDALYGIHALRARENFPDKTRFPLIWYRAIGAVKLACYRVYERFSRELDSRFRHEEIHLPRIDTARLHALIVTAEKIYREGAFFDSFIVPAISGGAGTSINMNINEIIANASLVAIGKKPGDYQVIDPVEQANVFQSTNDVIPTALKVALIFLLRDLEEAINLLRTRVEAHECEYRHALRIASTEMQEAVPSSYGKLFGAYSDALSRDWWRVSKCFERIKLVNLGGSAVGTGLGSPRFFIFEAAQELQRITSLPVTRAENLSDATSNLDSFVEVSAIIKAHAVNLEKMASDLRFLSSDMNRDHDLTLPLKQVGSSIMPGKINPVISEFVISAAHRVYANDMLVTSLAGQGLLDLNAYLPAIGVALIESLELLRAADETMRNNLFDGLVIDTEKALKRLYTSPSLTTALIPYVGYHRAVIVARVMREEGLDIITANKKTGVVEEDVLLTALKPEKLLRLGYSVTEMLQEMKRMTCAEE